MDPISASLDDVLITAELARRPTRTPDYESENRALTALAEAIADSPQMILQKLVETALALCRADSAGISILEPGGVYGICRWYAIAGLFKSYVGGGVPREASPGGLVLDRDTALLFAYPERHFDYGMAIDPPIVEGLFVPFHTEGKPVGTLWVIAHTPSRQFDMEDQRLLTSLSRFAGAAYQMKTTALSAVRAMQELGQVLDISATGITRCSRGLRYVSVNRAYAKLVGLPAEEIIGRQIIDVIGKEAFEVKRPYVERALRGECVEYEEEVPYALGGRRFLHIVYTPWVDDEGHVAGWVASVSDITDLQRATTRLQERERLRLALAASGAGSWMRDARTGRVDWDDRFRELYGFTPEEPASFETWLSRIHAEDRRHVLELCDSIPHTYTQDTFDSTFRIVRPDGTVAWIQSLGQAHRDAEGKVIRFIGLELDVNERRCAEEALRESEEREAFLLRLWDTLRPLSDPIAIQEVTARLLGEYMHVNRVSYVDIDGTDYIIRVSHANGVAPLVGRGPVAAFGEWLLESYRSGEPIVVNDVSTDPRFTEIERAHLQATEIAAFAIVTLVKNKQWVGTFGVNNATTRVWTKSEVELIREVAERFWEAVERARAEEALREREQRLSLALDASAAGVWTWDRFTNEAGWDDRFHAQFGLGPEDPRTFDTWISHVYEEDRQRVLGHIDDVLHGRYTEWNVIYRAVRPDGSVSWMHGLGRADHGSEGEVTGISGINLDITERRRAEEALQARRDEERDRTLREGAEEALRRSHAELEQRTLQLRRLASQLTLTEQNAREHLARTLHDGLQQLLFSAGMTLDQAVKPDSQDHQVALVRRAHADVKEAMEAARTLSLNLFPPMLHIGGLPAALAWLAKRTREQYRVVVNVTADPQANPAASDARILLFEAVRELLFNAVKHAHVDRVDVNLGLGPGDTIHIEVSDEGIGFDPTATLHHENQHQVGLGLFSIQERLALLGGHLDILSAPGKGAQFSLILPRTDLPRQEAEAAESRRHDAGWQERMVYDSGGGTPKSLRILIVDDHAVARAGLRELFSRRPPLQVVGEAANGVEAISQAMALQPDVIVMDVSMPQMNGIEATREIHGTLPHIPIVGLSTHDDENTERSMRRAGAVVYFTKNEGTERLLNYLLSLIPQAKGASTN
jgi:PAS domain S-box-containing protein